MMERYKKLVIKAEMSERWIPYFFSMLKYMEYLGNIGSSRMVSLFSDGDGDFNPKFEFDIDFDEKSSVLDLMTTQFDMNEVEEIGLLKFDFLQLSTLRQISLALDLIQKNMGKYHLILTN